ncbi:hypothetical protein [Variovorax sp. RCC_210]|uniref:hypothetical protein n=1 Tax=Variovorax sp. RCC_210 TaxID=3239217 RepID=UPI00352541F6
MKTYALDVLIVESKDDQTVPHPALQNYLAASKRVRSVTCRVLSGATTGRRNRNLAMPMTRYWCRGSPR